jgi:hypothetical protein
MLDLFFLELSNVPGMNKHLATERRSALYLSITSPLQFFLRSRQSLDLLVLVLRFRLDDLMGRRLFQELLADRFLICFHFSDPFLMLCRQISCDHIAVRLFILFRMFEFFLEIAVAFSQTQIVV